MITFPGSGESGTADVKIVNKLIDQILEIYRFNLPLAKARRPSTKTVTTEKNFILILDWWFRFKMLYALSNGLAVTGALDCRDLIFYS